jgi:hypothetical protein
MACDLGNICMRAERLSPRPLISPTCTQPIISRICDTAFLIVKLLIFSKELIRLGSNRRGLEFLPKQMFSMEKRSDGCIFARVIVND